MYLSFKLYLSNEASNELLPKIKVVDLEILSKFGIQKFFHLRPCRRRKFQFSNWSFELRFIYETAITSIPSHLPLCSRRETQQFTLYIFSQIYAQKKNLNSHACCVALLILKNLPQAHLKESNLLVKFHYQLLHYFPQRFVLYTSSNRFMSVYDLFVTSSDLKILLHTSDPVEYIS